MKCTLTFRLLATTFLNAVPFLVTNSNFNFNFFGRGRGSSSKSGSAKHQPKWTSSSEGAAIGINRILNCPRLKAEEIDTLNRPSGRFITRHFEKKYLKNVINGYYRFGTLFQYKPADSELLGRFSDHREGAQRDVYTTEENYVDKLELEEGSFNRITFEGWNNHIEIIYNVNDYCSCSSIGKYDPDRAENLKRRGNDELGAFATYDLEQLLDAVLEIASETEKFRELTPVIRPVEYGQKDRHWRIPKSFNIPAERHAVAVWLDAAFIKSLDYKHEEEVRFMLVNRKHLGRLQPDAGAIEFLDARIADCIVESGLIDDQ